MRLGPVDVFHAWVCLEICLGGGESLGDMIVFFKDENEDISVTSWGLNALVGNVMEDEGDVREALTLFLRFHPCGMRSTTAETSPCSARVRTNSLPGRGSRSRPLHLK